MLSDDVTVTVVRDRRSYWVTDGKVELHYKAAKRGEKLEAEAVALAKNWAKSEHVKQLSLYMPTVAVIDGLDKFGMRESTSCKSWRGNVRDTARYGKLPVHQQMIWDNALPNKSVGVIEHEDRESERRLGARLYDRSGNWR